MKKNIILFSTVTALVIGSWAFWPHLSKRMGTPVSSLEERGQFGDSYGNLNTLFTGLAFIGVAGSIFLQISESRKRDAESKREAIEARFFRLNDALRAIISDMVTREKRTMWRSMSTETVEQIREGKDAFEFIVNALLKEIAGLQRERKEASVNADVVLEAYATVYGKCQDDLGPYFRMLYRIFTYIERASENDRTDYAKIVRAEFSGSEVIILAANGASSYGKKFKPFIQKYDLLKHYPVEAKIPIALLKEKYK